MGSDFQNALIRGKSKVEKITYSRLFFLWERRGTKLYIYLLILAKRDIGKKIRNGDRVPAWGGWAQGERVRRGSDSALNTLPYLVLTFIIIFILLYTQKHLRGWGESPEQNQTVFPMNSITTMNEG